MNKKIFLTIFLIFIFLFSLVSCNKGTEVVPISNASMILTFENDVTINRNGEVVGVSTGTEIFNGDIISTLSNSEVCIKISDTKFIFLSENTTMEVTNLTSNNVVLTLLDGDFFFDVAEDLSESEYMAFNIKDLDVAIKDTSGFGSINDSGYNFSILTGLGYASVNEISFYINPYTKYESANINSIKIDEISDISESIFEYIKSNEKYRNKLIELGWNIDLETNTFIPPTDVIKDTEYYAGWKKDESDNWYFDFSSVNNIETQSKVEEVKETTEKYPNKGDVSIVNSIHIYDGTTQSVEIIGFDKKLMRISGESGKNAGEYVVKISPKTKWSDGTKDTIEFGWKIDKKDVTFSLEDLSVEYGEKVEFKEETYDAIGNDKIKYSVCFDETEVGEYIVEPVLSGTYDNYNITIVPSIVKITKRKISVSCDDLETTYGDAINPVIKYQNLPKGVSSLNISVNGINKNVGTWTITPYANEDYKNYDITFISGTLKVKKKALTITVNNLKAVYGDTLTPSASVSGLVYDDKIDYTFDLSNVNIGTRDLTINLSSSYPNYDIKINKGTLEISKRNVTVSLNDVEKTFGDTSNLKATITNVPSNLEQVEYTISGIGKDVGTYSITPVISKSYPNYNITTKGATLTVAKKKVTIKADDVTINYNDEYSLTATETGIVDGYPISYSLSSDGINVGEYEINISVDTTKYPNYDINLVQGTLVINPGNLKFTSSSTKETTYYPYKSISASVSCSDMEGTTIYYRINENDEWRDTSPSFTEPGTTRVYVKAENPNYNTLYGYQDVTIYKETQNAYIKYSGVENGYLVFYVETYLNGFFYIASRGTFWNYRGNYYEGTYVDIYGNADVRSIPVDVDNSYFIVSVPTRADADGIIYNLDRCNYGLNYLSIVVSGGEVTVTEGEATLDMIHSAWDILGISY